MSTQRGTSKGHGSPSGQTKRVLEAAPALAKAGLSKVEAAREMGVSSKVFGNVVRTHLPNIQWRDGRENNGRKGGGIQRASVAALAAEGLSLRDIGRRLGVAEQRVRKVVKEHGIKRCDLREGFSEQTKRIIEAAPALAERGLSKSEAARELGVSPPVLTATLHRRVPDIQWRDGRERAPSTAKDDERSTMRRVMAETLAGAQQPPAREGGGIGR